MTQDPWAAAWDGADTATADPWAAAWDAAPKRARLPLRSDQDLGPNASRYLEPEPTAEEAAAGVERAKATAASPGQVAKRVGGIMLKEAGNLAGEALNSVPDMLALPDQIVGATGQFVGRKIGSQTLEQGSADFLKTVEKAKPRIPTDPESPMTKLGGGLGFMAQAVAAPELMGLKGAAALLPGAVMGGLSNGYAQHQAVIEQTGDPVKAMTALIAGAGVGAGASVLPVARVLARLNGASGGVLVRALGDAGVGYGVGAAQSTVNDLVRTQLTGEELDILARANEQGGLGALTQILGGAVAGAFAKHTEAPKESTDRAPVEPRRIEDVLADENAQKEQSRAPIEEPAPVGEVEAAPPAIGVGSEGAAPGEVADVGEGRAAPKALSPAASARADELLAMPRESLERELVDRIGLEDATLREEKPGRDEAWYQRVAELRRQARDEGNPEAPRAAEQLAAAKIKPSGQLVEEVISALRVRDDMSVAERAARKGTRPAEKFERAQAARAEIEQAWREFGDSLRGKAFSGVDPEVIGKAAKVAKAYVKAGTQGFVDFAHDAIARFGEAIRPHVHDIWRQAGGSPAPLKVRKGITEPEAATTEVAPKPSIPLKIKAPEPKAELPVQVKEPDPPEALPVKVEESASLPVSPADEALTPDTADFYPSAETKAELVVRKVADRFGTLRRVEKEAPGKGSDFSGAETRMHGRAAVAQRALERVQEKAVAAMREANVSAQRIGEIASARHAQVRNKIIAERTNGENLEGSGMSDARAQEILATMTPAEKRLMAMHDEVRDQTLDFAVKSGLISEETRAAWEEKFGETFASLKTIGEDNPRAAGSGKSLQVRGPESKRAEGRETEATNPYVSMFQNAQDVILRGERNIVAQEVGKLVENNPGPWAEFEQPDGAHAPTGEDVFTYKVNGEPRYIRFRDKGTLKAVKNLDPVVAGTLIRVMGKAGRVYAGLHTAMNPDFIGSNFSRDLQTAGGNITAEESVKTAGRVIRGAPRAAAQIGKAIHKPEKATGYAKEYLEHGALTDWIEPQNDIKRLRDIETKLAETPLRTKVRAGTEAVKAVSASVENGVRFSYFTELRKAGVPPDVAAVKAKELTVNWSKKGEWGQVMNALYIFSSASANGTARFARAWAKPKRAISLAGSLVAVGAITGMYNRMFGGTDKKDGRLWWDKQPESAKRRNLMIQHADGHATKIPSSYGWGFFPYMGDKLVGALYGEDVNVGDFIGAAIEQFSPVDGGSVAQWVTPWFFDQVVAVDENKKYDGRPIYTERDHGESRPYASLPGEQRATNSSKVLSQILNSASGGNVGRRGSVDIPPNAIDYMVGEGGGGVGRFFQRIYKSAEDAMHGKMPLFRDMPFVNRFQSDAPKSYLHDFYVISDRIDVEDTAAKAGVPFDSNVLAWKKDASKYAKAIAELRTAGRDAEADDLAAEFIRLFDQQTRTKARAK